MPPIGTGRQTRQANKGSYRQQATTVIQVIASPSGTLRGCVLSIQTPGQTAEVDRSEKRQLGPRRQFELKGDPCL